MKESTLSEGEAEGKRERDWHFEAAERMLEDSKAKAESNVQEVAAC